MNYRNPETYAAEELVKLRGVAALFPYRAARNARSRNEYVQLAAIQAVGEIERRMEFHKRLSDFKKTGGSVRSAIAVLPPHNRLLSNYLDNHVLQGDRPPLEGELMPYSQPIPYENPGAAVAAAAPPQDGFYDESPPLVDADYAGVQIEDEYDRSMPSSPVGDDGQPDVHDWSDACVGVITKIGFFPYRYKPNESKTHMVRVGTLDHWGVDLERLVREFSLVEGDKIALKCIGKQPVVIKKRVEQEGGGFKMEDANVMRNSWVCKRVK